MSGSGPEPNQFQLFVKSIDGKTRTLNVNTGTTIGEIKQQMQQKEGIGAAEQRLIFGGKNLEDNKTLADYNLMKDSTLHMVIRVQGG